MHSRLRDLDAVFVPYVKPGYDLAQAIRARAKPHTRVFVLGNHGLVVGGERTAETERLLREVSRRLEPDSPGRGAAPDPVFARRLEGSGWISAPDPVTRAIARDPARLAALPAGWIGEGTRNAHAARTRLVASDDRRRTPVAWRGRSVAQDAGRGAAPTTARMSGHDFGQPEPHREIVPRRVRCVAGDPFETQGDIAS